MWKMNFMIISWSGSKIPNTLELQETKYITPFIIWANYDIEDLEINDISANYLSTLILDITGLKMTPYNMFLKNLYKQIPVITGNGYMDKTGIYHTFDEENEYSNLINDYRILQYNNMFDNSNRINSIFEVSENRTSGT